MPAGVPPPLEAPEPPAAVLTWLPARSRQSREDRPVSPNIRLMAALGIGVVVPVVLFIVDAALATSIGWSRAIGVGVCLTLVPIWVLLFTRRRR